MNPLRAPLIRLAAIAIADIANGLPDAFAAWIAWRRPNRFAGSSLVEVTSQVLVARSSVEVS